MDSYVVSGGVIINPNYYNQILLVENKGGFISVPKGHVEENESIYHGALREIYEETGITELTCLLGFNPYSKFENNEHKICQYYMFLTTENHPQPKTEDVGTCFWSDVHESLNYHDNEHDQHFIEKHCDLITEIFNQLQ